MYQYMFSWVHRNNARVVVWCFGFCGSNPTIRSWPLYFSFATWTLRWTGSGACDVKEKVSLNSQVAVNPLLYTLKKKKWKSKTIRSICTRVGTWNDFKFHYRNKIISAIQTWCQMAFPHRDTVLNNAEALLHPCLVILSNNVKIV